MMKLINYFIIGLIILGQSCIQYPDYDAEKKAIMLLHNEQKRAHIEKNVSLLLKDKHTDYIEVNRGLIRKPTNAESRKRFQSYFNEVDFIKWDDVSPPIISFSDDATIATTIVEKLVITKSKIEDNRIDTAQFAWLAVYKKINGQWQLHIMASTNK